MEKELGQRAMQTHDMILAQGMALIQEKGFRETSIRDICEAAEVSVGTFYSYFKNKGDLFRYRFQGQDRSFADFLADSTTGGTASQRLLQFIRYYTWLNLGTSEDLRHIFFDQDTEFFTVKNPLYSVLYDIIRQGQESGEFSKENSPEKVMEFVRFLLRGIIYEWIMTDFVFDLEAVTTDCAKTLLSFLAAPEAPEK